MDYERINAALQNATDTQHVVIDAGVLGAVDAVFSRAFGEQAAIIVADETTYRIAGSAVNTQLAAASRSVKDAFVFPGTPALYAEYERVLELAAALRAHDAIPIAVGSGTLNDITKLAAHQCGRPYMVIGTAASMDGYTAFGAAITRDGFKQTFACPAPRAVLADLDILTRAPSAMTASGYGDLLGKITAGADWLLADALGIEQIDQRAWALVQHPLREWLTGPELLRRGDQQATARLVEGLILSGLAMQSYQTSRPASGSEHQFSHLWEMESHDHTAVSHGFKIGVGSVAVAALYEQLLARDLRALDIATAQHAWPSRATVERNVRAAHTVPIMADKAVEESLAKYVDAAQIGQRMAALQERWPELRERLAAQLMTAAQVQAALQAAGAPTDPAAIGVDLSRLQSSYCRAQQIRRRYTVLDLLNEAGILSDCVDTLFAPGGFWASEKHSSTDDID